MRIAFHQVDDAGLRAGRILLGERRLTALGLVGKRPSRDSDDRLESAGDLSAYDALVSDDNSDPVAQAHRALDAGTSCVLWHDRTEELAELNDDFSAAGLTLLVGANLASGIAPSLASHEKARSSEVLEITYAWTEPGRPLRRGEAIPFPDPVGARWARERDAGGRQRRFVAPVDGEWAAAMTRVTTGTLDGVVARIVGVADLAAHLEGLALAAGAISISEFPFGLATPELRADAYLAAALNAGLDVAAYTLKP